MGESKIAARDRSLVLIEEPEDSPYAWGGATIMADEGVSISIQKNEISRAKADLLGFTANELGVSRDALDVWLDWIGRGSPCRVCGQPSLACGIPSEFKINSTPFCLLHKPATGKSDKRAGQPGIVYLVHAVGTPRYKIGKTTQLATRIKTLDGQSPYPVELVAQIKSEDIHQAEWRLLLKYANYRAYRDWFELPLEAVQEICAMGVES